jgi:hypothetical protein
VSVFKSPFTPENRFGNWKMHLLSDCLLMASDRRPAGRKVAPLPRTSWTFLNEIQFRVQRWWVHPKVQRREQTDWPFVDLQMSLKFPPNALLQLSAYHNENIRSVMLICGFHHPEGREATSSIPADVFLRPTSENSCHCCRWSDAGAEHDVRKLQNDSSRSTVTRNLWENYDWPTLWPVHEIDKLYQSSVIF